MKSNLFLLSDVESFSSIVEKLYSIRTSPSRIKSFKKEFNKIPIDEIEGLEKSSNSYYSYIPVWIDPSTGKEVTYFEFSIPNLTRFQNDRNLLDEIENSRLDIVMKSMKLPYYKHPYVFIDDDKTLGDKEYFNEENPIRNNWDTETHILLRFSELNGEDDDFLVFSKSISEGNRLTYRVYRPKYSDTLKKWVSRVEFSRCYNHYYENIRYDEKNTSGTTIGELLGKSLTKVKGLLGGKVYSDALSGLGILKYQRIYTGPSLDELNW